MTASAGRAALHAQHAVRAAKVSALFSRAACAEDAERRRIRKDIVVEYLPMAEAVARRYAGRRQDWGDIRQVAYVGLVKAAARFDPAKSEDFASFAVPTIAGEIKRHLRDNGWFIRPPRRVQEVRSALLAAAPRLAQELGREPGLQDLADGVAERLELVAEALNATEHLRPASLDAAVYRDEAVTLGETLGGTDPALERAELGETLRCAIRSLTLWERRIVYLRFFEDRTQSEIAGQLGVTQMQVSRLLAKILGRLRIELSAQRAAA